MGVIVNNQNLTWAETARREGFDDAAAVLGELGQINEFIDEVPWYPSTHGIYNKQLQAKRLGKGAFSKAYAAITAIASQADLITEPVKMYEGDSQVDERVFRGVQDAYKVRDSEDAMNLEGLTQDWNTQLVYNNEGDYPDSFKSITRRRNKLVAGRTWTAGGSGGDTSSILLFEFSKRGFYLTYPQDAAVGLVNEDRGRHLVPIPVGTGSMWAWCRHYEIWAAMVLRDDRALQRIANIETAGASNIFSPATFIKAKNYLPMVGQNAVAFANRTLKAQIDNDAYAKANVWFSVVELEGYGPITRIAGIPLRMMEALIDTEATVAA